MGHSIFFKSGVRAELLSAVFLNFRQTPGFSRLCLKVAISQVCPESDQ